MTEKAASQQSNAETKSDQKVKKKPRRRWRLVPSTLAGRAAFATAVFLLVLVVTTWVLFLTNPDHVPWRHSLGWGRMLGELVLVIVIPILVYRAIKVWSTGERSLFPEIDHAWNAGLAALAEHDIPLRTTPVYLILGMKGTKLETRLLRAAQLELRVIAVPDGPAPLHWYASPDAIFLVLRDTSWLGSQVGLVTDRAKLQGQRARMLNDAPLVSVTSSPPALSGPESTAPKSPAPQPTHSAQAPATARPPQQSARQAHGTLMLDQFLQQRATEASGKAAAPGEAASRPPSGQPGAVTDTQRSQIAQTAAPSRPRSPLDEDIDSGPAALSANQIAELLRRVQYVGHLLRYERHPICSANGILVVLPFEMFNCIASEVDGICQAVSSDLLTLQRELRVACPITMLVSGMEKDEGFQEIIRRIGRDRAINQRFGRGFSVKDVPTVDVLRAFVAHICGSFEDWVYALFREEDSLSRPGNTHLYGLLSKVRCTFRPRLESVMTRAFGGDADGKTQGNLLFNGCYFAATGAKAELQAFVKGVIHKLLSEQDSVQWTDEALQEDRGNARLKLFGWLITLGFLGGLIYMASREYFGI